jgi:ribosomal protein L14
MIQPRSMLDVADNSGARGAVHLRALGGSNKRTPLGDIVIVAVKEACRTNGEEGRGRARRRCGARSRSRAEGWLVHPF